MSPDTRIYLATYYSITSETRDTGEWFGWHLLSTDGRRNLGPEEDAYKFRDRAAAVRMAEGWIRINRPDLVRAAEAEAAEARRYQAARRAAD